jgi:hypothetical protein
MEATQKQLEMIPPGAKERDALNKRYMNLEKSLDTYNDVVLPTILQQLKIPVIPRISSNQK